MVVTEILQMAFYPTYTVVAQCSLIIVKKRVRSQNCQKSRKSTKNTTSQSAFGCVVVNKPSATIRAIRARVRARMYT